MSFISIVIHDERTAKFTGPAKPNAWGATRRICAGGHQTAKVHLNTMDTGRRIPHRRGGVFLNTLCQPLEWLKQNYLLIKILL
jgi:hypothetical protein